MTLASRTYLVVLLGASLWCGAIVLTPVLAGLPDPIAGVGEALYGLVSPVCHQIEARSFTVAGLPFAVCARCTAVYFGFLAGVLLFPILRSVERPVYPPRWLVGVAVLPMVTDVILGWTGIHGVSAGSRLMTGGVFGVIAPFVVLPALIDAVREIVASRRNALHHPQKGFSDA
jgi:uncharacterized membrane protein